MTNSEIIENAKMLYDIKEKLHTFAKWKELGYVPQKEQHAIIKERLWKSVTKLNKDGKKKTSMLMTTAALFSESQVVKL